MTAAETRSVKPMPAWVKAIVPKPTGKDKTIRFGESYEVETDTIPLIKKRVKKTLWQTAQLAAKLKGRNVRDSARNVWQFIYDYIKYAPDDDKNPDVENRDEWIRDPSRTVWEAKGDCDCMVLLASSLLTNMGIAHELRIMKQYKTSDPWGHIYVIIPQANNKYITIDCVTDQFDYEAPHVDEKDFAMKVKVLGSLKSLQGTDNKCLPNSRRTPSYVRAQQFIDRDLVITEFFLKQNAVPYTVKDDAQGYGFIVGNTLVAPIITHQQAAQLLPSVQHPDNSGSDGSADGSDGSTLPGFPRPKRNLKLLWWGIGIGAAAAIILSPSKKAA